MNRRKGRHWQDGHRPSVYAIRHRLHNQLRPTGRFLRGAEIYELPTPEAATQLPAIGGAR